ncbi:MAG: sigma-70 family RNA polymerase sigma factor [Solirubrobacteraceae bacterium]
MASIAPACTEHELISAARGGDDRAFEELYSRYRERIGAFISSRVRDHGRAEDVAQEVFISALRRLRTSEQAIAFKPWIYEIAKNACIDEFRRNQRTREVPLDVDDDEATGGRRALLSLAPTPAAAVESKQRLDDLRGAFGGLSGSHHQLLVMREFEGLSYDEIGKRTGMSRQMVESALFRARRKLTEEYHELASGRRCQQVCSAIEDGRVQSMESFGIRERRQLMRHLAHCQPCRVTAHLAGADESLLRPRSIGAKIAALLPFPLLRWPWRTGAKSAVTRAGSHHATLQSLQGVASAAEPAGATAGLGGAAVAAAAIALAGAGGAILGAGSSHARHPACARAAAAAMTHTVRPASASAISPGVTVARSSLRGAPAAGKARGSRASRHGLQHLRFSGRSASSALSTAGSGAASKRSSTGQSPSGTAPPAASGAGSTATSTAGTAGSAVKSTVGTAGSAVKSTVKTVGSTVNSTTKTVGSTLDSTTKTVGSTLDSTVKTVGSTASKLTSGLLP